jgi:hypothetical protein
VDGPPERTHRTEAGVNASGRDGGER